MRTQIIVAAVFAAFVFAPVGAVAKNDKVLKASYETHSVGNHGNSSFHPPRGNGHSEAHKLFVKNKHAFDPHHGHFCTPPYHSQARSHACPNTASHAHRPPFCRFPFPDDCNPHGHG